MTHTRFFRSLAVISLYCFSAWVSASPSMKLVCECSFEQVEQTVAEVKFNLGFVEEVVSSGQLRLEVWLLDEPDQRTAAAGYRLGELEISSLDFSSQLIPVSDQLAMRALPSSEGYLVLLLLDNNDELLDQVVLGPDKSSVSEGFGYLTQAGPPVMIPSGLNFDWSSFDGSLDIPKIVVPALAGTSETWRFEIVITDDSLSGYSMGSAEVGLAFNNEGIASVNTNVTLDFDISAQFQAQPEFSEIRLWIYRDEVLYLSYWLESLAGNSSPPLVSLTQGIDAVKDTDGDGLSDYVEQLLGSSPELPDALGEADLEIAFTFGATVAEAFSLDLTARIAQIVEVSNLAFESSGVPARVVKTDLIEIGNDKGYSAEQLIPLMEKREDLFSDLDTRFTRRPDLIIHLGLIDEINTGGLANLQGSFNDGIFDSANYFEIGSNVGVVGLDNSDTTLVHEIGHLLGLDHSRAQGTAEGVFPWSLGFGQEGEFVTIMAYSDAFSDAPEISLFSSPGLACKATSCGIDRGDLIRGADAVTSLGVTAFQAAAISNGYSPVIRFAGGSEVTVASYDEIESLSYSVADGEDGDLSAMASATLEPTTREGFDYQQTIEVSDQDGNIVEAIRWIKILEGETGGSAENEFSVLDIDENGKSTALTDGLLIIRHFFGFVGSSLTEGATADDALLTDPVALASKIETLRGELDVDEDGQTRALSDGLLIIRFLFGFEGDSLVQGAVDPASSLNSDQIFANLIDLSGASSESGGTTGDGTTGGDAGTSDSGSGAGEGGSGTSDGGSGTTDDGSGTADEGSGTSDSGSGTTDDGSGTSDGGTGTVDGGSLGQSVEVLLNVVYERVSPIKDLESQYLFTTKLDYDSIKSLPGRYLDVAVFDAETNLELENDQSWTTDSRGQAMGSLPVGKQVYFKVFARSVYTSEEGEWSVSIHDNQGSKEFAEYPIYVAVSDPFTTDADQTIDLSLSAGWTGTGYGDPRSSAPFAILDSVIEAMLYMRGTSSRLDFPHLPIYWSTQNSYESIGTSYYENGVVFVLGKSDEDTDEFDAHVIVHEWGHYLQDKLSRDDSFGGPHGTGDILDPRVAFSEGWANALAGLVLRDSDYKDTTGVGQTDGFYIPLEEGYPASVEQTAGWFSETSVAELVMDLFDTTNDAADADTLALPISEMTRVLTSAIPGTSGATTIFSLFAPIIEANEASKPQIKSLLQNQNIALDEGVLDVFGMNEKSVPSNVTDNALPIYKEVLLTGAPVRVCQDKLHTPKDYDGSLGNANKLGNKTLGRFKLEEAGDYLIEVKSGAQNGMGASEDPDIYVFQGQNLLNWPQTNGAETKLFEGLSAGHYWFEIYDWGYLSSVGGGEPCQIVEISKQ